MFDRIDAIMMPGALLGTAQPVNQSITLSRPESTAQGVGKEIIRVLVADDHAIVRKGICALLATEPDIEVIGEARDGREAIAEAKRAQPDVILMDLVMPAMDGLEATRRITTSQPEVRVLVLTSFAGDDRVFPAIKAGALGYLLKDSGPEELVYAIQQVYRGKSWLHPTVARRLLRELSYPVGQGSEADPLTGRELEVLQLVAQSHNNRDIAEVLEIGEATGGRGRSAPN